MRLSELTGKEIVAVDEGIRLGTVAAAELLFATETGRIEALLIPAATRLRFWSALWGRQAPATPPALIPWRAVEKIGPELVLVRLAEARNLPPHLQGFEF
ncbi:MAG TPA: YlmC/YmxH family sporulation protein [Firmicutes bacterium]|nr:YlmC/YmxH family sporulation protein [Bacillota bacterium]